MTPSQPLPPLPLPLLVCVLCLCITTFNAHHSRKTSLIWSTEYGVHWLLFATMMYRIKYVYKILKLANMYNLCVGKLLLSTPHQYNLNINSFYDKAHYNSQWRSNAAYCIHITISTTRTKIYASFRLACLPILCISFTLIPFTVERHTISVACVLLWNSPFCCCCCWKEY